MSNLFKTSFLLTVFFALNKVIALGRQYVTARQFGLGNQIDAFNVANNIPDLLFSIISGTALALAFIPVLSEYLETKGEKETWLLFSRVANLVFLSTAFLSLIAYIAAPWLITSPLGIAPGFTPEQAQLTVELMRLNLIATLIFSVSGLLTAALQAHKHFLMPALAPILHNVGLLIGMFWFVNPVVQIGPVVTPGLGAGIYGLEYGVILGSLFHLGIQLPAAFKYKFRWRPQFSLTDTGVMRVLKLMGPRILTVFLIQMLFFSRDNFASRLESGSITALTYGFFILQVPETLIGTAIGTALLPTLSQYAAEKKSAAFSQALASTIKVIFASTTILSLMTFLSLDYFLEMIFNIDEQKLKLLSLTTKMFFLGLTAHSLLEVTTRAFYAHKDTKTPFWLTIGRVVIFIAAGFILGSLLGAPGLALADAVAVTSVVVAMLFLLRSDLPNLTHFKGTLIRAALLLILTSISFPLFMRISPLPTIVNAVLGNCLLLGCSLLVFKEEISLLKKG